MKILIFSQYFPPETNAPAHRLGFFAHHLARVGHSVTVICEPPNYPKGMLFSGYQNKWRSVETLRGVRVIRSWVWITPKKSFLYRILNYTSFLISASWAGFRVPKPDVIFATSPPLFGLFAGALVAKARRVPLVSEIRDIWPDSALAVGMVKKNLGFRIIEAIEKKIYRQSAVAVVNAEGIMKRLHDKKGVPREKMALLTNGAELELFRPDADSSEIEKRYALKDKFVALYTGLLGLAQAPKVIIEAANLLKDKKDIVFVVVGEGALKAKCEELAKKYDLRNVVFTGERPRAEMPAFAARADVAVIPYKNESLFKDVIPSKMFDYMAAAKPLIINLDGEGAAIIRAADCGLVVAPEDPQALAKGILKIYDDKKSAEEMGKNGRRYAEQHYDRKKIAERLETLLARVKKS